MRRMILTLIASVLVPIGSAEACGRRCGCRAKQYHRVAAPSPPTTAWYPATYAAVQSPTPQASPAATAPAAAQPTYSYDAAPDGPPAYYHSYNDNGELIVKQWMDWLFRGGRAAGVPAPPPPIIGRILRP